jgi:PAS domain S-box-containing protein
MNNNRALLIRYAVMATVLVGLVLLGGLFVVYNSHRQHQEQDIKIYRYSLAQEAEALRQTYYQLVSISNLLVKNPVVINSLDRHLNGEEATEVASQMVERNLEAIAAIENVSSVFLVSLDGICLHSSRKDRVGKNYGESDYVRNALKTGSDLSSSGFYAMMAVASGRTSLYYAQAIKNGSLRIGVAVIEIRPNFFHLHSFTVPFTDETPQPTDVRIGLSTDGNILLNTAESSLVSLTPEGLPPQATIQSLNFLGYNKEELGSSGLLRLKNADSREYYIFSQPVVGRSLALIHVISQSWFHENYHPASSNYFGYLAMLGIMLLIMLALLSMVNRRHRQMLLAAETLKNEAERRTVEKEKYEAIINRNPQGFWLNDFASGVILEVNQSLCRLLDLDASEIIGHSPDEFLFRHEESGRATHQVTDTAAYEGRLRLRGRAAADVLVNSSCIVVPGSGEKICFSFFADISERKKEQEQLFLFSQAVEQSTSAIVITDRQAKIVYVNPAFSELTGWSREEICGTDPGILTGEETYTAAGQEIWRQISSGGTWKGVLQGWKKDGSQYWEGQTICPLYDKTGRISYYLAIKNDITQRLDLEQKFKAQLTKLELMVDHAAIGIAHMVEPRCVWASRTAFEMFGYDVNDDITSLSVGILYENEEAHQEVLQHSLLAFAQDQVYHDDRQLRRKDGSLFWCSLTGKIIDPEMPDQGAVWLIKDISRQKEEEHQLQIAKERAEQANQAKNDFLASISHELRTPMNAIIGMNRMVLGSGLLNEEHRHNLSKAKNAADFLLGLIDDLLDFSRIEAGRLRLAAAPFVLEEAVHGAVQTIRYPAEEKGLRLRWEIAPEVPRFVTGDALRLRQILVNLLKNSIKFSEQGEIFVRAALEERREGQVLLIFTVSDQGIGIPQDKLNEIFERFVKVDFDTMREGIGLGLTICSQLCTLMGGRISVQSELGKGSVFTFTAWFDEVTEEEEAKLNPTDTELDRLRILVVDDNEVNRFVARARLQQDGHEVAEAKNGEEALKLVLAQEFDAVLMDVQMPVMDGLTVTKIIRGCEREDCCMNTLKMPGELCETLRTQLKGRHLPIVALTANNFNEQCCREAGMDAYTLKPFNIEDTYRAFRQCCLRKKKRLLPMASDCNCITEQAQAEEAAMTDTEEQKYSGLAAKVAEHLRTIYGLDSEQVEQMVQISASSIGETLTEAKKLLAAGDLAALSALGHKAKGVLLGIGLNEEAEFARQIELKGKSGEETDYAGLLKRLEEGLSSLLILNGGAC